MIHQTVTRSRRVAWPALTVAAVAAAILPFVGCGGGIADDDRDTRRDDAAAGQSQPVTEQPLEYVHITSSMGEFVIELDRAKAPVTVANFLQYVEDEFYDGTIFHRVMPEFVIQGGGFTAEMSQKETRAPITNEWQNGLKNTRGTLSMARRDNPNSATSQFFINVVDNETLDQPISGGAGYAVFGKVIAGMDVIDKIRRVPTTNRAGHQNVPREPVVMERARRVAKEEAEKLKERIDRKDGEGEGQ